MLRSGGRFVLGIRPAEDPVAVASLPQAIYSLHTLETMTHELGAAGFEDIRIVRSELKRGFIAWAICS